MPQELKVPLGLDPGGAEVRPEGAEPHVPYACPDCRGELVLRRGATRRAHFAHKATPDARTCDFVNETEEHWRAKHRLAQLLREGGEIRLVRRCAICKLLAPQRLPGGLGEVTLEQALPGGYRADVALLQDGRVRAVFEVLHEHAVDPEKAAGLEGTPWVELSTETILGGRTEWLLVRDHLLPWTCARCRTIERYGRQIELLPPTRQKVLCPLRGSQVQVDVVEICARCAHFIETDGRGVLCVARASKP